MRIRFAVEAVLWIRIRSDPKLIGQVGSSSGSDFFGKKIMNILLKNGPIRLGYTHLSLENLKNAFKVL